jgi:Protein of unknown function (DUF5656)
MFLEKRKRFIVSTIILSAGLFAIQFPSDLSLKFISIGVLGIACFFLFWWSLREGLKSKISFLILILPIYYTVGAALFWFLLPKTIMISLVLTFIYGLSLYVLFLTTNVFSVSSIKTIALYRAAKGVGFLLSLVAFFLALDGIISLRLTYIYVGVLVFFVTLPLYLQGYWTSTLQEKFDRKLILQSLISSYLQAQLAVILFFWPVGVIVGSLFMTVYFYILLGLGQAELEGRLFPQTVQEYLMVGVVVFSVMFFSTSWVGY